MRELSYHTSRKLLLNLFPKDIYLPKDIVMVKIRQT